MFEVEGKPAKWHTAFYYLAEHVRALTAGSMNHKELYALVGVDGRYVNHANPTVRKRMAGALSRIVHTERYVSDMQARYRQDGTVFRSAAKAVYDHIRSAAQARDAGGAAQARDAGGAADPAGAAPLASGAPASAMPASAMPPCFPGCGPENPARAESLNDALIVYLRDRCWPDVRLGFCNEQRSWRSDLDLFRVDQEIEIMFRNAGDSGSMRLGSGESCVVEILAALFHIISFGRAEHAFSRALVDEYPTEMLNITTASAPDEEIACLVRFSGGDHSSIMGSWNVTPNRPFTIGRYADNDVVVGEPILSRRHCCLYRKFDVWYFEDMGSRNGSRVVRPGVGDVFDSARDGVNIPIALEPGDSITLASICHLWFGFHHGRSPV